MSESIRIGLTFRDAEYKFDFDGRVTFGENKLIRTHLGCGFVELGQLLQQEEETNKKLDALQVFAFILLRRRGLVQNLEEVDDMMIDGIEMIGAPAAEPAPETPPGPTGASSAGEAPPSSTSSA